MLAEALLHWLTPAPKWAKTMGYVREQVALDSRHRRRRADWQPHLEHCRAVIRQAAESCPQKNRCVVLGSGHLLDIPLDALAADFARVELVDIAHPRAVRRRVKGFANVTLIDADISGVAEVVYGLSQLPPPEPKPDAALIKDADLVISSNLLSQLPLAPLAWLERRHPGFGGEARQAFARAVIDHHLALLQHHDGQVCLISEVMRLIHDLDRPLEKIDPLFGAALMYEGEEWWWEIAPRPELSRDFDVRLRVLGLPDLANAAHARYCRNTTLAAP